MKRKIALLSLHLNQEKEAIIEQAVLETEQKMEINKLDLIKILQIEMADLEKIL